MIRSHNLFPLYRQGLLLCQPILQSGRSSFALSLSLLPIDFWQADRPAISFCMVSRELRGVDSTLALHSLSELILDVKLPDVDGVLNAE